MDESYLEGSHECIVFCPNYSKLQQIQAVYLTLVISLGTFWLLKSTIWWFCEGEAQTLDSMGDVPHISLCMTLTTYFKKFNGFPTFSTAPLAGLMLG